MLLQIINTLYGGFMPYLLAALGKKKSDAPAFQQNNIGQYQNCQPKVTNGKVPSFEKAAEAVMARRCNGENHIPAP